MNFVNQLEKWENFDFENYFSKVKDSEIERVLCKNNLNLYDYLTLLSPAAEKYLEAMAQKAHALTVKYFGRTIQMYTPLYLSNYCENRCLYCGFNCQNIQLRSQLSLEDVKKEAQAIYQTGMRHIIILTGDAKKVASPEYLKNCTKILSEYFSSITIEVYAMEEEEYRQLIEVGVDGLTIYQETYDRIIYDQIHESGPKKDYVYRLLAPERAAAAGMRSITVGALLGLNYWRNDAFFTGMHANYLHKKYSDINIAASMPRIRPHVGGFAPKCDVTDKNLVQFILAYRLFMPYSTINISTRESQSLRDRLIKLGVNKMSAGSVTSVGGHAAKEASTEQFEISDTRNIDEMVAAIKNFGYQPLFKDWVRV